MLSRVTFNEACSGPQIARLPCLPQHDGLHLCKIERSFVVYQHAAVGQSIHLLLLWPSLSTPLVRPRLPSARVSLICNAFVDRRASMVLLAIKPGADAILKRPSGTQHNKQHFSCAELISWRALPWPGVNSISQRIALRL